MGFNPFWDYKHYNQYFNKKFVNLITTNKKHLKCDVIDCSIVDALRPPLHCFFILDKLTGLKVFCGAEAIHYKKINKSVLNTIIFYIEDDNNEEVNFTG